MSYFITLIAKYCFSADSSPEGLSDTVKERIAEFNLENYQEYQYHNKIMRICEGLFNGSIEKELKQRESVPIYENELRRIHSLANDRQRKLLFTLFALARYMDCGGWINKKTAKEISEVFKLANITLSSDKRNELLHELYTDGHIAFGKRVDNLNIRVTLEESGEIGYQLKEFQNLGYQYIGNFKKGYKQCVCCGKAYKIKSSMDFSSKYCDSCAKLKRLERSKNSMRKLRESQKC